MRFSGLCSVRADGVYCTIISIEECGRIEKNADGTYTRVINGTPALRWLKVAPGKDL